MAGAQPGVHALQLEPVRVPETLQRGSKFIKWDEDTSVKSLVTLRVDSMGFYLYWTCPNMEVDILDISLIRDTRTGKYAKIPKHMLGFCCLLEKKKVLHQDGAVKREREDLTKDFSVIVRRRNAVISGSKAL